MTNETREQNETKYMKECGNRILNSYGYELMGSAVKYLGLIAGLEGLICRDYSALTRTGLIAGGLALNLAGNLISHFSRIHASSGQIGIAVDDLENSINRVR